MAKLAMTFLCPPLTLGNVSHHLWVVDVHYSIDTLFIQHACVMELLNNFTYPRYSRLHRTYSLVERAVGMDGQLRESHQRGTQKHRAIMHGHPLGQGKEASIDLVACGLGTYVSCVQIGVCKMESGCLFSGLQMAYQLIVIERVVKMEPILGLEKVIQFWIRN